MGTQFGLVRSWFFRVSNVVRKQWSSTLKEESSPVTFGGTLSLTSQRPTSPACHTALGQEQARAPQEGRAALPRACRRSASMGRPLLKNMVVPGHLGLLPPTSENTVSQICHGIPGGVEVSHSTQVSPALAALRTSARAFLRICSLCNEATLRCQRGPGGFQGSDGTEHFIFQICLIRYS